MLQVKLDTGFNIEIDFMIAPFIKRFFAWLIDIVIIIAWIVIISRVLPTSQDYIWALPAWVDIVIMLPPLLYWPLSEIFLNGQTVGKIAMQIKVIAIDGGNPSVSQFLIRWLFRMIDIPWWIPIAIMSGEFPWWSAIFLDFKWAKRKTNSASARRRRASSFWMIAASPRVMCWARWVRATRSPSRP